MPGCVEQKMEHTLPRTPSPVRGEGHRSVPDAPTRRDVVRALHQRLRQAHLQRNRRRQRRRRGQVQNGVVTVPPIFGPAPLPPPPPPPTLLPRRRRLSM
jgi:hypothetical protein